METLLSIYFKRRSLFAGSRIAFLFTVCVLTAIPSVAQAPSAGRKIMDEVVAALGGAAFLDVKEIQSSGRFYSFTKGELSAGDVFVDYMRFPLTERTDLGKDKKRVITLNKGAEGWSIDVKAKQVLPQKAADIDEFTFNFQTSLEYVLRFVLRHPQTTIQSLGDEIVNFRRADVVELRDPAKNLIRFYVDRATRLPIKMQVRRTGKTVMREDIFNNWHVFGGVKTPLFISHLKDGVKYMEVHAELVDYNPQFTDDLFAPVVPK